MSESEQLFERVSDELREKGCSIIDQAIPDELRARLLAIVKARCETDFQKAGVGRGADHQTNQSIRSDAILWIEGQDQAERDWLSFMAALQDYLNRRLFLGLFSFESHFAHYAPGAFYEKHRDAFRGQSNRVLTVVMYLNQEWQQEWGGELVVYDDSGEGVVDTIAPIGARMVIFLSEEFPHEVLAAQSDRYSIAGWFRVNNSDSGRVDPPR